MDPQVQPLSEIYDLNSRLFRNCLEGVDDEMAQQRINTTTNSITFIAAHLADCRYYLSSYLGGELSSPLKEFLSGVSHIEHMEDFPPLDDVRSAWREVTPVVGARLAALLPAELSAESPQRFPVDDRSVLGGVAFLLQHESYHIGQLGFLRKCLIRGAMRYE